MRRKIKELLFIKSYCVFAVLFSKKILTKQNIAFTFTEITYQFLAPKGSRLEEK